MKEDFQNGDLYDVYYTDNNGKEHCVCYFGHDCLNQNNV